MNSHNEENLRDTNDNNTHTPSTGAFVSDVLDAAMSPPKKKLRGFALLSPERRKEISSKGGKKAHEMGLAHEFDHDLAVLAGRKGGQKYAANLASKRVLEPV